MGGTVYRTVYFALDDPADLDLLGLLLALPRSRRNRILKAALREALSEYLHRHHPEIAPLPPEAVAAAVAAARRPPRRQPNAARSIPADPVLPPATPVRQHEDGTRRLPQAEPAVASRPPSKADQLQEAEQKLDRLIRSLGAPPATPS